jgi:hypothetical protein
MTRVLDGGEERGAEKVRAVRSSNGLGALHLAAARGKLPVCRYLVDDLGLDVNSINEAGGSSLFLSVPSWFLSHTEVD